MKIGIPDDYADMVRALPCFSKLAGHEVSVWNDAECDVDVLVERFADLDALVLLRERTKLPGALIQRLPKLKLITINGPHPNIDVETCTAQRVVICVGHGRISYATAELTWGLILASMRQIPQQVERLRNGGWQSAIGTTLRGRTLGIIGFGKIGSVVASYGRAFGMNVLVWSRATGLEAATQAGYETTSDRSEIFRRSDVVSLHVRYGKQTDSMVTADDLALMHPASLIVNTSRAGLIAPGALEAALRAGRPGFAAVDVYEQEPVPPSGHPLLSMQQALCTPHLGYVERDQMEAYFSDQFDRVLAFAAGNPVDVEYPEALLVDRERRG